MTDSKIFKHSHAFLNYIFSVFQGIFIYENVLMRLKHPDSDRDKYIDVQNKMKTVVEQFQELWENKPLLEKASMTDEAEAMLRECSEDLVKTASLCEELENRGDDISDEELASALGMIAKAAYIAENFLNGVIAYCEHMNLESELVRWEQQITETGNATDRAGYYLTRFEAGLDDRLRHDILALFRGYSGIFRAFSAEIEKWHSEYEGDKIS